MSRKASANDIQIAYEVLFTNIEASYRDAVHAVAARRKIKPKAVYGIVNRARNDKFGEARLVKLAWAADINVTRISRRLDLDLDEINDLNVYYDEELNRRNEMQNAMDAGLPEGHHVKGTSKLFNADGQIVAQWVKTDRTKEDETRRIEALLQSVTKSVTPRQPLDKPIATRYDDNCLALYPLADLHVGLYASQQSSGADWNLQIAKSKIEQAIDSLVSRTHRAKRAVIANLGDFTHVDNHSNATPRSGAKLDADGSYFQIINTAMDLMIYAIDRVAEQHDEVEVIYKGGNHDWATAVVMQAAIARLYANSPNITVEQSDRNTSCLQFGRVALAFTHGDTLKAEQLPLLMATDYPQIWAATTYRVFYTGHIHHLTRKEFPGCTVESLRSPVPKDTWHSENGYRSLQDMNSVLYGFNGEVARNIVYI